MLLFELIRNSRCGFADDFELSNDGIGMKLALVEILQSHVSNDAFNGRCCEKDMLYPFLILLQHIGQ